MTLARLNLIQKDIMKCRDCPGMAGRPVHGAPVLSRILLIGQAPGIHEEGRGRPFAHTAGKTLFRWFEETAGVDEAHFRSHVYMAAVARCFPGKAKGGGDRLPDADEIRNCRRHLALETALLRPKLILPVGKLAISQVLGPEVYPSSAKLADVVGKKFVATFLGETADVYCLPHPSGLSTWHQTEPGKTLLKKALRAIVKHSAWISEME
jgi:uracil-DNA glycosylase